MNNFFWNACKFVGRVLLTILACLACVISFVLTPLSVLLSLISAEVAIFYLLTRKEDLVELALCKIMTEAILTGLLSMGLVKAEVIEAYAKRYPYCLTNKAVKRGAKKFSISTLSNLAVKKERYFAVPEFTLEFIKRGERDVAYDFSSETIERLVSVACEKRCMKELDEILQTTRTLEKSVNGLSEDTLIKLLYNSSLVNLNKSIIGLYRKNILLKVYGAKKGNILKDMITKSAPSKQQTIELLRAFAEEPIRMEGFIRLAIQQHGISPQIIAECGDSYTLSKFQMEYLSVYIREREDRITISKGVDALKNLLKNRDLTCYGQTRLVKKELFEAYIQYLDTNRKKIGKSELGSLIANADFEVVLLLEEHFKQTIDDCPTLSAMLSARKGQ